MNLPSVSLAGLDGAEIVDLERRCLSADHKYDLEELRIPYAASRCLNQEESLQDIVLESIQEDCRKRDIAREPLPFTHIITIRI